MKYYGLFKTSISMAWNAMASLSKFKGYFVSTRSKSEFLIIIEESPSLSHRFWKGLRFVKLDFGED